MTLRSGYRGLIDPDAAGSIVRLSVAQIFVMVLFSLINLIIKAKREYITDKSLDIKAAGKYFHPH